MPRANGLVILTGSCCALPYAWKHTQYVGLVSLSVTSGHTHWRPVDRCLLTVCVLFCPVRCDCVSVCVHTYLRGHAWFCAFAYLCVFMF